MKCVTLSKANVTLMKEDIIVWPLNLNKSAKITVEMCFAVTAGTFSKTRELIFNKKYFGETCFVEGSEEVMWNLYGSHTVMMMIKMMIIIITILKRTQTHKAFVLYRV